jgi:hypothetical protein
MYMRIYQAGHDPASACINYSRIVQIYLGPGPFHRRNLAVAHQQVILTVKCACGIDHPPSSEEG